VDVGAVSFEKASGLFQPTRDDIVCEPVRRKEAFVAFGHPSERLCGIAGDFA
jgi:hypothetical protein